MENTVMETLDLQPGTVIHICGWPVETVGSVTVTGTPANVELVKRDLYLKAHPELCDPQPPAAE